jgi:hypothetical protein
MTKKVYVMPQGDYRKHLELLITMTFDCLQLGITRETYEANLEMLVKAIKEVPYEEKP